MRNVLREQDVIACMDFFVSTLLIIKLWLHFGPIRHKNTCSIPCFSIPFACCDYYALWFYLFSGSFHQKRISPFCIIARNWTAVYLCCLFSLYHASFVTYNNWWYFCAIYLAVVRCSDWIIDMWIKLWLSALLLFCTRLWSKARRGIMRAMEKATRLNWKCAWFCFFSCHPFRANASSRTIIFEVSKWY